MRKSLGMHVTSILDPFQIIDFLRNVFIAQLLYVVGIATIKFTVLAFYWRLFAVNARIAIYIVTFMAVGWLIALVRSHTQFRRFPTDPVRSSSSSLLAFPSRLHGTSPLQTQSASNSAPFTSAVRFPTSSPISSWCRCRFPTCGDCMLLSHNASFWPACSHWVRSSPWYRSFA